MALDFQGSLLAENCILGPLLLRCLEGAWQLLQQSSILTFRRLESRWCQVVLSHILRSAVGTVTPMEVTGCSDSSGLDMAHVWNGQRAHPGEIRQLELPTVLLSCFESHRLFSFFGLSTESMVRKACDIRNWCFLMGSSFKALFGNSHLPKNHPVCRGQNQIPWFSQAPQPQEPGMLPTFKEGPLPMAPDLKRPPCFVWACFLVAGFPPECDDEAVTG